MSDPLKIYPGLLLTSLLIVFAFQASVSNGEGVPFCGVSCKKNGKNIVFSIEHNDRATCKALVEHKSCDEEKSCKIECTQGAFSPEDFFSH